MNAYRTTSIESDAANPFGREAGVLARRHAMVALPAARE